MAITTAAKQTLVDGMEVIVAGGQEYISALQYRYSEWVSEEMNVNVSRPHPYAYMSMRDAAEFMSKKYQVEVRVGAELMTFPVFFQ